MTRFHALAAVLLAGLLIHAAPAQDDKVPDNPPEDQNPQATESGIQYSVLRAGTPGGVKPKKGDICRVHYTGYHAPGGIFDSSVQRKEPFHFEVGKGVIAGWSEGIQLMTPGSRFKFTIPHQLAYGEAGRAPTIAPSETLVFVIDLIDVFSPTIDKSKQKEHASKFKYEVLAEGKGNVAAQDWFYEFHWAEWSPDGKTCYRSSLTDPQSGGKPAMGKCGMMSLEFLNEAARMMKPGARMRLELPAASMKPKTPLPPGSPEPKAAIWVLEMVKVIEPLPSPPFAMPPAEKLTTTASGLQYRITKPGSDPKPKLGETVRVHYIGWLADGTKFDASYDRAKPAEFQVGRVIAGWNEGLQLIGPGGEIQLVIPAKLGYGDRDNGPIPAGSTLVFHIELLAVNP